MKAALPLLAAALLLPSCIESNIGTCIRESGRVHTGVDVFHPADGKVWQTPAQRRDKGGSVYVLAPEVNYRICHPLFIRMDIKGARTQPTACDIRPTGRQQAALADGWQGRPTGFDKAVGSIPASARAVAAPVRKGPFSPRSLGSTQPPTDTACWRYVAAAPFDFLLDPVLSVTASVADVSYGLVTLPFFLLWESLSHQPAPPATTE